MIASRPLSTPRVAVVVTPHGFGHAARACALVEALAERRHDLRFHIFTTVPRWFFAQSLSAPFFHHRFEPDVGLVQRSPLDEDLGATVERLDELLGAERRAEQLAGRIDTVGCRLLIADIAPLAIAAAGRAGIPSVLVENFSWDWIYRAYVDLEPELARHAAALAKLSSGADLHVQTDPVCRRDDSAIVVPPVARRPRLSRAEVRATLGVPGDAPLVLLTMGGLGWSYRSLNALEQHRRAWFVVPGGARRRRTAGRLVLLPFRSELYHPDLVRAADVVVGKLGYSTVAEAYHGRAAMAFISRPRFPESAVLARFVRAMGPAVEISQADLDGGAWLDAVDELLEQPRRDGPRANGAELAADIILERFGVVL